MTMPPRPFVTTRTREVFGIAHAPAHRLGHDELRPLHVVIGMVREGNGVAPRRPTAGTAAGPGRERAGRLTDSRTYSGSTCIVIIIPAPRCSAM